MCFHNLFQKHLPNGLRLCGYCVMNIPLMLGSGRPSATSNEFIVRECPDRHWNVHRNVRLKPDPRIPNPNPRFSSFRSALNLWPLPASTNSFPYGAATRNKQHHHLNVEPDLPGQRTLLLVFSPVFFTAFPFCRSSRLVPVTSEPLWMPTSVCALFPD